MTRTSLALCAALLAVTGGCHLGDLLAPEVAATPGDGGNGGNGGSVQVAALALTPADTTLNNVGDTLCLRWAALDTNDVLLTDIVPTFTFTANPGNRLAFAGDPGCVVVVSRSPGQPARVHAATDTATAEATVRVRP